MIRTESMPKITYYSYSECIIVPVLADIQNIKDKVFLATFLNMSFSIYEHYPGYWTCLLQS